MHSSPFRQTVTGVPPSADCSRRIIATESVFSMDGDTSDIAALVELAGEFDALLVVDEAHATGVLGERGMGLTCGKGVDLCVGTFGKALGSFGAYIACGERLWEYLVNCCSGFIYTTALPPAVLGAVDAALELVSQMDVDGVEMKLQLSERSTDESSEAVIIIVEVRVIVAQLEGLDASSTIGFKEASCERLLAVRDRGGA